MTARVYKALLAAAVLGLGGCASTVRAPLSALPSPSHPAMPADVTIFVERATAMVGRPYRYGGETADGFDCSGLVVYAAEGTGIRVPRTTHEQLRTGVPLRRTEVAAGDLVFMHLRGHELHVGIALDAKRFVHAPAAGRQVRIDSLDSPTYAKAFLTARRVIGDVTKPASASKTRDRGMTAAALH